MGGGIFICSLTKAKFSYLYTHFIIIKRIAHA